VTRPRRGVLFRCAAATLAIASTAFAAPVRAQLISPGRLSSSHTDLEGVRNCTQCHRLRERGVVNSLCLSCHEALRARVDAQRGYHATVTDRSCAECHKEHFGTDFALVRLDTTTFEHDQVGFTLEGHHAELSCRECHTAGLVADTAVRRVKAEHDALDRTYLGLATTCNGCHADDDPHDGQFGDRGCTDCHAQERWQGAELFDHRTTDYPLTGRHRSVECAKCHAPAGRDSQRPVRYADLPFASCTSCHRDPHDRQMGADCTRCHSTDGWSQITNGQFEQTFDHATVGYTLRGAHGDLACVACHSGDADGAQDIQLRFVGGTRGRRYPTPASETCASCHLDYHRGAFRGSSNGADCRTCHTEDAWRPTTFGVERHNDGSTFELTGAHVTTACVDCHRDPATPDALRFRWPHDACTSCHEPSQPQGQQFAGRLCTECHDTEGWIPTIYGIVRHNDGSTFQLTGAHVATPCMECHRDPAAPDSLRFRLSHEQCVSCHEPSKPHGDQFAGQACSDCHTTDSFRIPGFDHSGTRFPLDGRHQDVACNRCHAIEVRADGTELRRYRPLGLQCEDCHGEGR
jgi:hypothetical protein